MPRFIALRKKSNVQTGDLVSLSVEDKRSRLVNAQLFPKHDEILTGLGFKQITLATSTLTQLSLSKHPRIGLAQDLRGS